MKFEMDGKVFTETELDNWKRKRIPKVVRNLSKDMKPSDHTDTLCSALSKIKESMTYDEIISSIRHKLLLGEMVMKLAVFFSFGKRRTAKTTIYADGIHVGKLGKIIDSLMMEDTVDIARIKDGAIIGGVRHQFKDTETGIEAKTLVEFPAICPRIILKEHQKHLAAEWSGWIQWAIDHP